MNTYQWIESLKERNLNKYMENLINKTINKIFMDESYLAFEMDNGEVITYQAGAFLSILNKYR